MTRSTDNPWLHRFAVFTASATLCLIGMGGLVTSHGAGLAVPDWPTTYGYNMFLFPISQWTGGIFYEHTHRLVASFVGLLTTVLAVWVWLKDDRRWLRWLGVAAFALVVVQGVLGGLRVTMLKDELGIIHATLAQLFFVLVCGIALWTSRAWRHLTDGVGPGAPAQGEPEPTATGLGTLREPAAVPNGWRNAVLVTTALILLQLVLGATMRHQHAGLAVPDFPLAYGKLWPPMDAASLERINRQRLDARDFAPVTAFQIGLHMAHRLTALVILAAVGVCAWRSRQAFGPQFVLSKLTIVWVGMVLLQGVLGALTVLKNKPADIATLHVVVGAISLAWGAVIASVAAAWRHRGLAGRPTLPHLVPAGEPVAKAHHAVRTV
jgi:cytochrome c oxidase assembly protein subunit 15